MGWVRRRGPAAGPLRVKHNHTLASHECVCVVDAARNIRKRKAGAANDPADTRWAGRVTRTAHTAGQIMPQSTAPSRTIPHIGTVSVFHAGALRTHQTVRVG